MSSNQSGDGIEVGDFYNCSVESFADFLHASFLLRRVGVKEDHEDHFHLAILFECIVEEDSSFATSDSEH